MRYIILCAILLLGFSNFSARAGTISPTVSDSKYLAYGQKHECVVRIGGVYEHLSKGDSTTKFLASAVVVRPRIVLTAAHVVDKGSQIYIEKDGKKIDVSFALKLQAYNGDLMGPLDIAICFLSKPVELDFYPELYEKNDEIGKLCSISGYGITGNHRTGAIKSDYKKRAGSNIIDDTTFKGMLVCSINKDPQTSLEFLISHGDSGGGLFIDQKLAGINSSIMTAKGGNLNSNYDDQSCHTRISLHKPWLDYIIEKLETRGESFAAEEAAKVKLGFL